MPPSKPGLRDWMEDVLKRVRAAVSEQLKALDLMGKYGLGTLKAITDEDIRERLSHQLEIVRASQNVKDGCAEALITEMGEAWR
jgi:hypothetical protein